GAGRPPAETVLAWLRPRRLLLVLDTCEHLIEGCARLAERWLRACPQLGLLATSREALGIAGETTWRVPSLRLPALRPRSGGDRGAAGGAGDVDLVGEVSRSEAGRLFVERARAVRPGFAVTSQE